MLRTGLTMAVAGIALLTACTYGPGDIDNPITRKFTWFSYVAADDIRQNCQPGALDHYRLVYNAVYDEQVRAYDLRRSATGSGGMLFARVFGSGGNVAVFDPFDPTGPWRGQSSEARLSEAEYASVVAAINHSGFSQPAPEGLSLPSTGFYWTAAACVGGQFHFNAWRHPSERFERLAFVGPLLARDGTGVPFSSPRSVVINPPQPGNEPTNDFVLRVGRNGLVGQATLF